MTSDPPSHPDDLPPSTPATSEPVRHQGSFQLPSDYYDTPSVPSEKPGCPRWVPLGCGGAGCLVLILMVLAGTYITKKGAGGLLDLLLAPIATTLETSMESDVTSAEKAALEQELARFRSHVRNNELSILEVQTVVEALRKKTTGRKMTQEDVRELTRLLREVNKGAVVPGGGKPSGRSMSV